jgi:hypothetical protein
MNVASSRLTQASAYVRAHGVKTAVEVGCNFILPYLIYSYMSETLGPAPALLAASAPPILWGVVQFIRERRVDAISVLVLSGMVLSLLAFAGGGGVKFLQLRENLVSAVVGLIFLGSAAIGRPLIYQLARAGVRRRAADKVAIVESLRDDARFRSAMMTATLAWGAGLLATCATNCALVFMLSIKQFLLVSGPISTVTYGLLTAWTFWFVPRAIRAAAERGAARERTQAAT